MSCWRASLVKGDSVARMLDLALAVWMLLAAVVWIGVLLGGCAPDAGAVLWMVIVAGGVVGAVAAMVRRARDRKKCH